MINMLLILAAVFALAIAWRKSWVRLDMWTGALCALPFTLLFPIGKESLLYAAWTLVLGSLAGALYALYLHRHFHPSDHENRAIMAWLGLVPVAVILGQLVTLQSFLTCSAIGVGITLLCILILQRKLIWDTFVAMLGMGILYVILSFFFERVLMVNVGSVTIFENALIALAFGSLWGPPYAALHSLKRGESPLQTIEHRNISRRVVSIGLFLFLLIGFSWLSVEFITTPKVMATSPNADGTIETLISPISIQLDRPLNRSTVKVTITPPVAGDVSFADPYINRTLLRKIIFTPETYFQPDTTYTVEVASLRNVLGQQEGAHSYVFHTPNLPVVTKVNPTQEQREVAICEPFTVELSEPLTILTEINFVFSPALEYSTELSEDKKIITVKPRECLAQSETYTFSVLRRLNVLRDEVVISAEEPVEISKTNFVTKGAPGITSVAPQGGGVLPSTKELTIVFTEPVQQVDLASFFTISPSVNGAWSWRSNTTAVFTFTSPLALNTHFTLSMKEGIKDEKGGFIPGAATFSFTTIGHVRVSAVSPRSGAGGVKANAAVRVSFDQPVDHASAEANFKLEPTASGTFNWEGQTMVYQATLSKDTGYRFTVNAGVKSTIGLDLADSFSSTFQTEESSTLLSIPVYYQRHNLSCEIAALKMGLDFKGSVLSEDYLLNALPTDSAHRNGNTWSDPDEVFVGDVNGRQNSTGYGVHAIPIATLARNYRNATVTNGWTIQNVAQSIADNNPVVIWGTMGSARRDSWVTPDGRTINTWVGEHARIVIGFTGSVENPATFIVNDPIHGRLRWSAAQFKANWGSMGNMGVAIL